MSSRYGPEAVRGTMYHFGHEDRKIELGLAGSPMITGPCCDIGWYLRPDGDMAARELTLYLDQMLPGPDGLVLAASYPQGAGFDIQRCLVDCKAVSRGSSLQSVLDSPGDVYFVDGQSRLFLKLVDETNLDDFAYAGVRILRLGNRYDSGKGARYKVRSTFSGSGQVSMQLPGQLPAHPTQAPPPTPTPAATPAPTPAPTAAPTPAPTRPPTPAPTAAPTLAPTTAPTLAPTAAPTLAPTAAPRLAPTAAPRLAPTAAPTLAPTAQQRPSTAPAPTPPSPVPVMDSSCKEFCGLRNLRAEGAWCGKLRHDQQACTKSYLQGVFWKWSHPWAHPCAWIDGTCKVDQGRSRVCPDLAAWCASQ